MANRRVPLANLPNATNSPLRIVGAKRKSHASDQRDLAYGQQPPLKKQMIEVDDEEARRNTLLKRNGSNPPTALQRKLEAVREDKKAQKPTSENLETIRQWQRHYKKAFPQFVFYFESIPDDTRVKILRQVQSLGAREEKFFSKTVTHVVTTRPIPPELSTSSDSKTPTSNITEPQDNHEQRKTIKPSLLERSAELQNMVLQSKTKSTFDTSLLKKPQPSTDGNKSDILHKARELGVKIWPLEKLQRMMTTMFNTETGEQAPAAHNTRSHAAAVTLPKANRENDLEQLLKAEKMNGPAVASKDMAQFQGYYIYIHDIEEKTRPVMIRDYPRAKTKEEGKWPQFRLTSQGRCPFVEDPAYLRKMQLEEQKERIAKIKAERVQSAAPRTRAAAALEAAQQRAPASAASEKKILSENKNATNRPSTANSNSLPAEKAFCKPLDPPKTIPAKRENPDSTSMPPMFGSVQASLRAAPRYAGGEPVASGVQPSNITSAIRSKMISSTAISSTAPGPRAGTSKEVHQLQRKVFEKNNVPSNNSIPSSYMNDVRAAINGDRAAPTRAAKRRAQENLAQINEEVLSDEENATRQVAKTRTKKVVEKELKPGYCENCREKFNDFDEHVVSRKHRKFAMDANNWTELDQLLDQLRRPVKAA